LQYVAVSSCMLLFASPGAPNDWVRVETRDTPEAWRSVDAALAQPARLRAAAARRRNAPTTAPEIRRRSVDRVRAARLEFRWKVRVTASNDLPG
jgi:hypothetical protein